MELLLIVNFGMRLCKVGLKRWKGYRVSALE